MTIINLHPPCKITIATETQEIRRVAVIEIATEIEEIAIETEETGTEKAKGPQIITKITPLVLAMQIEEVGNEPVESATSGVGAVAVVRLHLNAHASTIEGIILKARQGLLGLLLPVRTAVVSGSIHPLEKVKSLS